jgi:hypothetical protein
MSGWIAGRIGLRLHNAAAQAAFRKIVDNRFSDEEAREPYCFRRKLGPADVANSESL